MISYSVVIGCERRCNCLFVLAVDWPHNDGHTYVRNLPRPLKMHPPVSMQLPVNYSTFDCLQHMPRLWHDKLRCQHWNSKFCVSSSFRKFGKQECVLERLEPPHLSISFYLFARYNKVLSFETDMISYFMEGLDPVNITSGIMCNENNLQWFVFVDATYWMWI